MLRLGIAQTIPDLELKDKQIFKNTATVTTKIQPKKKIHWKNKEE